MSKLSTAQIKPMVAAVELAAAGERFKECMEVSEFCREAGEFNVAMEKALFALELARMKRCHRSEQQALTLISIICLERGPKPREEKYFLNAIKFAERLDRRGAFNHEAALLYLARFYILQQRWLEAESTLDRLGPLDDLGPDYFSLVVLQSQIQVYTNLGKDESAEFCRMYMAELNTYDEEDWFNEKALVKLPLS